MTVEQLRSQWLREAHILWCHPTRNPRRFTSITPLQLSKSDEFDEVIDRVAAILLSQGHKNLLGSVHENLKKLVPLILEEHCKGCKHAIQR